MTAQPPTMLERIEDFLERAEALDAAEAEAHLLPILVDLMSTQGFDLEPRVRPDTAATDFVGVASPGRGQRGRLGIEYKHYSGSRRVDVQAVHQVTRLAGNSNLDRVILVSKSGFTDAAHAAAAVDFPTSLELLTLNELRALAASPPADDTNHSQIAILVHALSESAARVVARNPRELDHLEWRDLERMMTVVLQGLGFEAELTPASKDGGKDILLRLATTDGPKSYVVELKHWRSGKRVGARAVLDFVEVVARERHESGLFLSTYGYNEDAYSTLAEVESSKVRLGGEDKIVSLCRTFDKIGSQLWRPHPSSDLPELLLGDA